MQVSLLASDLGEMSDDPTVHVQCINTKGVPCTFTVTLTLSKASARKLRIPAKIFDGTLKAKKSASGTYLYAAQDAGFSRKVLRAFDRAVEQRIDVDITLAGSFSFG